jgi:hypothetical protein
MIESLARVPIVTVLSAQIPLPIPLPGDFFPLRHAELFLAGPTPEGKLSY